MAHGRHDVGQVVGVKGFPHSCIGVEIRVEEGGGHGEVAQPWSHRFKDYTISLSSEGLAGVVLARIMSIGLLLSRKSFPLGRSFND